MTLHMLHLLNILSRPQRFPDDLEFMDASLSSLPDLQQYTLNWTKTERYQLYKVLQVETFKAKDVVFRKGDQSEKLYVVLEGTMSMTRTADDGKTQKISTMGFGRIAGQRGLLRGTGRMLTATADQLLILATLDKDNFNRLLAPWVTVRTEEKLRFIDEYIPGLRRLVSSHKDQLAFAMKMLYYRRGHRLLNKGEKADCLFFISHGECAVLADNKHVVVKLGEGCCFGEESLLTNRLSEFTVEVASESAWVYELYKYEANRVLPQETHTILLAQHHTRLLNWNEIIEHWQKRAAHAKTQNIKMHTFPQASRFAQICLQRLASRMEATRTTLLNSTQSCESLNLRSELLSLRDSKKVTSKRKIITISRSQGSSPYKARRLPNLK